MRTNTVALILLFAATLVATLRINSTIATGDYITRYNLERFRNSVVLVVCEEPGSIYQFFGNSVVISASNSETLLLSARHLVSTGCLPYARIGKRQIPLEIKKIGKDRIDLVLLSFPRLSEGLR